MKMLAKYQEGAYALMRVVTGAMFAFHGMQKIFGILTEHPVPFGGQIWVGGVLELVCGLLVMAGLQTRWAAFLASGEMAVAYTQFHWKLQMGPAFFPAVNKGEPALQYCLVFFYIACRGAGLLSLDKRD